MLAVSPLLSWQKVVIWTNSRSGPARGAVSLVTFTPESGPRIMSELTGLTLPHSLDLFQGDRSNAPKVIC